MNKKRDFPTNEEIRQSVIHIIRATPNKEIAASSIVSMLIDRLVNPIKAEWGKLKYEMKEKIRKNDQDMRLFQKKMKLDYDALEASLRKELEAAKRKEDDAGEEWKNGA